MFVISCIVKLIADAEIIAIHRFFIDDRFDYIAFDRLRDTSRRSPARCIHPMSFIDCKLIVRRRLVSTDSRINGRDGGRTNPRGFYVCIVIKPDSSRNIFLDILVHSLIGTKIRPRVADCLVTEQQRACGQAALLSSSDSATSRFSAPSEYMGIPLVNATAMINPSKVVNVIHRVFHILRNKNLNNGISIIYPLLSVLVPIL